MRPEREGFHARVWPRPPTPWLRFAGAAGASGALGVGLGLTTRQPLEQTVAAAAALAGFGLALAVVSWLPGFAPVELEVDDTQVYWNGERYPWARLGGARAVGGTLTLHDPVGSRVDDLHHLPPEVASWLAAALQASVPAMPFTSRDT